MNSIKILLIIFPVIIILILISLLIILLNKSYKKGRITYFKCSEKPNGTIMNDIFKKENIKKGSKYNLYLPCGYNNVENELLNVMNTNQLKYVFGLKGCDTIVSKNSLWDLLEKSFGRDKAKNIMPESFVLNNREHINLLVNQFINNPDLIVICKKNIQRKNGLLLINNIDQISNAIREDYKVAQIYKKDLLLIMERKVNLRIYLLIVVDENNRLTAYINKKGKCLYTNKKYNGNNMDFESNITSFNVDQDLYKTYPHTLNDLGYYLNKMGYNWKRIWFEIENIFKAVMEASYQNFKKPDNLKNKICFQLFGADIILDKNGKPFILEINKGPDMVPKFDKDYGLKKNVYNETFNKLGLTKSKKNDYQKILYIELDK
jgi:hypothetical protein